MGDLKRPPTANLSGPSPAAPPPPQPVAPPEVHAGDPLAGGEAGRTAEYYFQQGRARFDRKEYHAAVHLLRQAVKLDPARPHYHFHLGVALITNPRTRREAEQHLAKSAELDPYNAQVRVKLGTLYKEAGLPKKAEHYYREALNLDPENRTALRELGNDNIKDAATGLFKRLFKK